MKKIIRLTESDLHRIVKNTVNRVLRESRAINEVGDTPKGQYMLGKLSGRHYNDNDTNKTIDVASYAYRKNNDDTDFQKGFNDMKDKYHYCDKETLEELSQLGYNADDFNIEEDDRVANFHKAFRGYAITYNGEDFGELWDNGRKVNGNAEMPSGTMVSFSGLTEEIAFSEMMELLLNDLNESGDVDESRQRGNRNRFSSRRNSSRRRLR